MRIFPVFCLLSVTIITIAACTTDALPEPTELPCDNVMPTYVTDVEPIIQQSCAYGGCHLGTAPGIYTSYEGLLPQLEAGNFRDRVITMQADPNVGMPPNYAPSDRPEDLTADQLEIIECWLDAGFPLE